MAYRNRIRLPLYAKTPQFPTEANRFRLADGSTKTLSVSIRKTYDMETDYMDEVTHQRLVVALNHDTVNIEGERYVGGISVNGEYKIDYPDFLDFPLGKGSVLLNVTPFDFTNSNCQTCETATQLSLVDDDIGEIIEGTPKTVPAFDNDSICCFPIDAIITWFETGYLSAATINEATGVVTLTANVPGPSVGSIKLATYRVTCPDGAYDEADIYGSIDGSEAACEQPGEFLITTFSDPPPPFSAFVEWASPLADPALGYEWILYEMQTPGVPVQTGTSADKTVTLTGLQPGTDYGFYARSVCAEGVYSPYTEHRFQTPASGRPTCGSFTVSADGGDIGSLLYSYSFMDCNGEIQTKSIENLTSRDECMLMDGDGNPEYFEADPAVTYLYVGPC